MTVDRYRELCARHRWNVPHDFNIAAAVCGRHANDGARLAIYWEDESGATTTLSFGELQRQANRCANALAALGVGRGDKRRDHAAAAARNRDRAHRLLSAGRRRSSVVVPVRPRGARIPAAEFGKPGCHRRSGIAAKPRADPRPLARTAPRDRRRRRTRVVAARLGPAAAKGRGRVLASGHARHRSGDPRLHQRNDRTARKAR